MSGILLQEGWRSKMKKPEGGYSYFVSKEQIREWIRVPMEQKLQWLEEANDFVQKFQSPKTREIMEKFRRGEI